MLDSDLVTLVLLYYINDTYVWMLFLTFAVLDLAPGREAVP